MTTDTSPAPVMTFARTMMQRFEKLESGFQKKIEELEEKLQKEKTGNAEIHSMLGAKLEKVCRYIPT